MSRLLDQLLVAMPGPAERTLLVAMIPRAHSPGERAVGVVEAKMVGSLLGQRAEVPFAGDAGVVADALQSTRKRHRLPGQRPLVLGIGDAKPAPAAAGHQPGPRRAAHGSHIMLRELESLASQAIKLWRRRVAAMKGHVGPAQVVGHDEHDVRGPGRFFCIGR